MLIINFLKKSSARKEITSCYYGPEYSAKEIKKTLDQCKVNYQKPKNLEKYVAKKFLKKN